MNSGPFPIYLFFFKNKSACETPCLWLTGSLIPQPMLTDESLGVCVCVHIVHTVISVSCRLNACTMIASSFWCDIRWRDGGGSCGGGTGEGGWGRWWQKVFALLSAKSPCKKEAKFACRNWYPKLRSKLIFMGNMEKRHMTLVVPLDFCRGYFYGFHPHTLLSYSYNGFLSSCCLFPRGIFMGIFDEFINWPCQEILVGEC